MPMARGDTCGISSASCACFSCSTLAVVPDVAPRHARGPPRCGQHAVRRVTAPVARSRANGGGRDSSGLQPSTSHLHLEENVHARPVRCGVHHCPALGAPLGQALRAADGRGAAGGRRAHVHRVAAPRGGQALPTVYLPDQGQGVFRRDVLQVLPLFVRSLRGPCPSPRTAVEDSPPSSCDAVRQHAKTEAGRLPSDATGDASQHRGSNGSPFASGVVG
mmetsp:Transcript_31648/g.75926  ORF Transcript_31648/g.75926 Transcript_31648/m.75926 type:complete len:219 (+) Transcript_31648:372-1028(+)